MGFLEDLNSGKYNFILFCIICILLFHQYWCISNMKKNYIKEPMADLSSDIRQAVRQVYLADIQAIRNLSEVASKLQREGLTIAGDLRVSGKVIAGGEISNNSYSLSGLDKKIDKENSALTKNITEEITKLSKDLNEKLSKKINNNAKISIENIANPGRLLATYSSNTSEVTTSDIDYFPGLGQLKPVTFYRKWKISEIKD
jgi:hypothetical protein